MVLQAADLPTGSLERLVHVACFAVSGYAATANRTSKPFNPLLGETYEFVCPEKGFRFISEKVRAERAACCSRVVRGHSSHALVGCAGGASPHYHGCLLRGPQVECVRRRGTAQQVPGAQHPAAPCRNHAPDLPGRRRVHVAQGGSSSTHGKPAHYGCVNSGCRDILKQCFLGR